MIVPCKECHDHPCTCYIGIATDEQLRRYVIMGERAARVLELRANNSWLEAAKKFDNKMNKEDT